MRLPSRQRRRVRALAATAIAVAAAASLTACSAAGGAGDDALVLYNAQHDELTDAEVAAFTEATGIEVQIRGGSDAELANQIIAEGDATPADVFVTENSPSMTLVAGAGGFAPIDAATREQVPEQYQAGDGSWVGWAARATVLPYDPRVLTEEQAPASIMDLADPKWQGKIGISPGGADFQAIVSAVLQLRGEEATQEWLRGLAANAKIYRGNIPVMKAIDAGEIETGVIYHYYWYKDRANGGANSANVALKYLRGGDPGAFVSVSGAGVLAASDRQEQAQQLVAFLTSARGQEVSAGTDALEYTVASGVPSAEVLPALDTLEAPAVDVTALNGPKVVEMMQDAGLI